MKPFGWHFSREMGESDEAELATLLDCARRNVSILAEWVWVTAVKGRWNDKGTGRFVFVFTLCVFHSVGGRMGEQTGGIVLCREWVELECTDA